MTSSVSIGCCNAFSDALVLYLGRVQGLCNGQIVVKHLLHVKSALDSEQEQLQQLFLDA
jgi:hypothetical protein